MHKHVCDVPCLAILPTQQAVDPEFDCTFNDNQCTTYLIAMDPEVNYPGMTDPLEAIWQLNSGPTPSLLTGPDTDRTETEEGEKLKCLTPIICYVVTSVSGQ